MLTDRTPVLHDDHLPKVERLVPSQARCALTLTEFRKLIYLPSVPPFTKNLTTDDYKSDLAAVRWQEITLERGASRRYLRGLEIRSKRAVAKTTTTRRTPAVVVVYLQGNAGTTLMRVPVFERIVDRSENVTVVAFSPQGYWQSSRISVSQRTLLDDYRAAIAWTKERFPEARVVLLGHSIGAAAAALLSSPDERVAVDGVILDCAMPPIPLMIRTVFAQRWLPYHYLAPFAWDRWDTVASLAREPRSMPLLSLVSTRDELIDPSVRTVVHDAWQGPDKELVAVDALHDTGYTRASWQKAVARFLARIGSQAPQQQTMQCKKELGTVACSARCCNSIRATA